MNDQTTAFKDVLDKFIHIGNCYYNGKHHDNVLNIFADLDEEDKKVFLRGVHHIYTVIEFGVESNQLAPLVKAEPGEPLDFSIDDYNTKLLVEMKFWFIKTFGILFVTLLIGIVIFILYLSTGLDEEPGRVASLFKVFGLLFN